MDEARSVVVRPLKDDFLEDVIRIHQTGLGYTLNSRLGKKHLAFLYRAMSLDDKCYVGVALIENRPVGVVSGALDPEVFKKRLIRTLPLPRIASMAWKLIVDPRLILEWRKGNKIGSPVYYEEKEVPAILTAIAVDPKFRSRGIGKLLITAIEKFFMCQDIRFYHLDTLLENKPARKFYESLGFQEIEARADSILFVKAIRR